MILCQFTLVKLQVLFAAIFLMIQQKRGCNQSQKKVLYTGRAGSSFPQGNKPHWYKHVHTGTAEFTLAEGCINITEQQLKSSASCLHRHDLIFRGFVPDLKNTAKTPNSTSNLYTEKNWADHGFS